jgi:hypothetical protein
MIDLREMNITLLDIQEGEDDRRQVYSSLILYAKSKNGASWFRGIIMTLPGFAQDKNWTKMKKKLQEIGASKKQISSVNRFGGYGDRQPGH